jgi:hypothetical protein
MNKLKDKILLEILVHLSQKNSQNPYYQEHEIFLGKLGN